MLEANNIFIKLQKTFMSYSIVQLLDQKIDSFDLATSKKKLKTIFKLRYSKNLQTLKTYLRLIEYMRDYVSFYARISKSFQKLKIELLQHDLVVENAKKSYSRRIKVENSTSCERLFFSTLQRLLTKSSYLVHLDSLRRLFVNLDANKKFEFEIMIYHVKLFAI